MGKWEHRLFRELKYGQKITNKTTAWKLSAHSTFTFRLHNNDRSLTGTGCSVWQCVYAYCTLPQTCFASFVELNSDGKSKKKEHFGHILIHEAISVWAVKKFMSIVLIKKGHRINLKLLLSVILLQRLVDDFGSAVAVVNKNGNSFIYQLNISIVFIVICITITIIQCFSKFS